MNLDDVPMFLRKQAPRSLLYTTRQYPCGCNAEGSGDVPAYCSEHGTPPKPLAFDVEGDHQCGIAPPGLPTGYDERKGFPLLTFLTAYFPDVIEAAVRLCIQGNVQHDISKPAEQPFWLPTDRIAWDRQKSTEELETLMRHLWDHTRAKRGVGSLFDADGHLHIVKAFWRAGTEAQRTIEALRVLGSSEPPIRPESYGGTD